FFGYNRDGELQYRGRIDECRPGASAEQIASRTPELLNAMLQIAKTGEGPREQVPSAGCSIKWK
ncbi:MAG: thioredoxin family protein, partial [Rhizobiaceae bacterium]